MDCVRHRIYLLYEIINAQLYIKLFYIFLWLNIVKRRTRMNSHRYEILPHLCIDASMT